MSETASPHAVVVSACPEVRKLARTALAMNGWCCEEAVDARGALVLSISLEPDLILVDFKGTDAAMSAVNLMGFSRNVHRVPVLSLDEGMVTLLERGPRSFESRPVHRGDLSANQLSTLIQGLTPVRAIS